MNREVKLLDPISGAEIRIGRADLHQTCPKCGLQMLGKWIASTETTGWECLEHLHETLAVHNGTDRGMCIAAARQQLQNVQPGQKIVATRQLLAAVGLK